MNSKQSFSDFKSDFYAKVSDFTLFDCAEFNALKIVLDGLKVDYVSRGKVKSPIFQSLFVYESINLLKRLKSSILKSNLGHSKQAIEALKNKPYLISDDGRIAIDANGLPHSYYFSNLMNALQNELCVHVIDKKRHQKSQCHFIIEQLTQSIVLQTLNEREKLLIANIRTTFKRIKASKIFNEKELHNIAFAFQNFFNQYKTWSRLLDQLNPSLMFCIVHYHNEGKMLAFKRKGIKVIELQHGLISTKDIFYVFPAQVKAVVDKALFADEIWVYGNYWKEVLSRGAEYSHHTKVAGYYLYDQFEGYADAAREIDLFASRNQLILITTQTFLHEPFVAYIKWLNNDILKRKLPFKILVKNHPLEKKEHYQSLEKEELVKIVNYPLPVIFKQVCMHVTIYSTTLYDGARAGVPGFSLYCEPQKDYIEEILKSGVAVALQPNQNPIDLISEMKTADADYYYKEFSISELLPL